MSAPVVHTDQRVEVVPQPTETQNWTINVSDVRTVKVSNISLVASEIDIREFFSFCGDIRYIETQRETENTQMAYVTFKDLQGADTALLLTGSNIANLSVTISPFENYLLPPEALPLSPEKKQAAGFAVKKAEDVMSTMLAKGYILGKDAVNKAKSFDERHHLTTNASATVASIDRKMGLTDKLSIGTAIVNEKVREMDERYQVSEKTKSAYAVAEQKATSAGFAIMSNPIVSTGASWVSSAFTAVAKAAGDLGVMTKEKVELAEVEKKDLIYTDRTKIIDEFGKTQSNGSSPRNPAVVPVKSDDDHKLGII